MSASGTGSQTTTVAARAALDVEPATCWAPCALRKSNCTSASLTGHSSCRPTASSALREAGRPIPSFSLLELGLCSIVWGHGGEPWSRRVHGSGLGHTVRMPGWRGCCQCLAACSSFGLQTPTPKQNDPLGPSGTLCTLYNLRVLLQAALCLYSAWRALYTVHISGCPSKKCTLLPSMLGSVPKRRQEQSRRAGAATVANCPCANWSLPPRSLVHGWELLLSHASEGLRAQKDSPRRNPELSPHIAYTVR